jgi:hypothetical protein
MLHQMNGAQRLPVRMSTAQFAIMAGKTPDEVAATWKEAGVTPFSGDEMVRADAWKVVTDGSNQGRSGYFFQPYLGEDNGGHANWTPEGLRGAITPGLRDGWQIMVHTNGDAAVEFALTAMEEPVNFGPDEVKAEKIKVLSATRLAQPLDLTSSRGQYVSGWQGGEKVVGLLDEEGFSATSNTETFAAITLDVDTRRWAGVPFYLRTGKRLGRRVTEIALIFKRAPHLPFDTTMTEELGQNALVIRVQPDEGITIRFGWNRCVNKQILQFPFTVASGL